MAHDLEQEDSRGEAGRDPMADLALIREMMEAGKEKVAVSGIHFIIWGAVLMVAFFAQYMSVLNYIPETIIGVWIPAFILGWGLEFLTGRDTRRGDRHSNLPLLVHTGVWGMVGIVTLIYFGVSMATGTFSPKIITILNAAMIGSAFWVTGMVTGITWLRGVASGWWLLLACSAQLTNYDAEMLLVMAGACGLLLLLPGFILRRLTAAEA